MLSTNPPLIVQFSINNDGIWHRYLPKGVFTIRDQGSITLVAKQICNLFVSPARIRRLSLRKMGDPVEQAIHLDMLYDMTVKANVVPAAVNR